ncbi:TonB-dependent receptor [Chitinophaga parva]|uniref:TonB-dependent receptor n=1 Tax=Chitinophaga parva TaxID=2169414 RepID=A0A2T7BHA4_9BACT|nr:TonB-dependent receptor [Chitinophaga parva]PUZ25666.1 TonB-dependent receptor [Chitinophaga parva]
MKSILPFFAVSLLLAPLVHAQVQNGTVSGSVQSSKGELLPGINVRIKHGTQGTATDANGHFSLAVKPQDTLVITGLGYNSQEIAVKNQRNLLVRLNDNTAALNEVIVVGYGTQKKSDLTGSITSINEAQFKKTPTVSLDNGLKGRAAGVQVSTTSGQPGGATSIRVRGSNSVNTGSEPLYVIDGFPVYNDNSAAAAGATVGPKLNALALINPNDIVSIEILKDASAAAVYGARGANGVVLITTRKGKEGPTRFDFNAFYGIQQVPKKLPLLNATDFANLVNDANGTQLYTPEQIKSFGEGTNWQDQIFRTAPEQNYQLTAAGGDAKTKYALSFNYFNQDGIVINSNFKRYATRFNLERQATSRLSFGTNLSIARTDANQALSATSGGEGTQGVIEEALAFNPILKVRNPDGTYVLQSDRGIPMGNPVATAKDLLNRSTTYRILGNVYANFKILDGLDFRTSAGADVINTKEKYYAPRTVLSGYNVNGQARVSSANSTSWLNENTLTYHHNFNDHALTVLGGFTVQKYNRETVTTAASGFVNDLQKADNLGAGAIIGSPVTNVDNWQLASFIGRINYAFKDKYLLTLTERVDGSSKFGTNNKFGYFPSGSVAWKLSEEDFIKQLHLFSELKIRASYGKIGNQEIASYQSLAGLSNMSYVIGDQVVKGYAPGNIPNGDLKWESTAQADLGLDAGFFNGRLNITADWYNKKTTDMLLFINVPWSTGFSSALQNIGSVQNRGVELGLNAAVIDKQFKWNVNLNIAANRNKVLSLGPVSQILTGEINGYLKISNPVVVQAGHPISSFFGYVSDGIFQTGDAISHSAQPTAVAGDRRYKDLNGDGKIDATDRKFLGNADPKFFGGMTHDFFYKGFDLSASFNWVYGNTILNSTRAELDLPTGQKNSSERVKYRWTPTNPSNSIPRASLNRSFLFSNAQLESGSYFRLGVLTLGYSLPARWLQAARIQQLRVYASALNLFTITHYTGYDPEGNQTGQGTILRGVDADTYPTPKAYMVGLNLNF